MSREACAGRTTALRALSHAASCCRESLNPRTRLCDYELSVGLPAMLPLLSHSHLGCCGHVLNARLVMIFSDLSLCCLSHPSRSFRRPPPVSLPALTTSSFRYQRRTGRMQTRILRTFRWVS